MKNDTLNKDLYPLLNIVKFVLAIFIIAVHTWFLIDYKIGYYLYNVMYRLGVPFFFTASGFLLAKKVKDNQQNRNTIFKDFFKRNVIIYLYLSCMYMVINLIKANNFSATNILQNIWQILIGNSWSIAWFLGALIISVFLIYYIKTEKQFRFFLILAIILYLVGLTFNTYSFIFSNTRLAFLTDFLTSKFVTNRNFVFVGFVFTLIGYYLKSLKWQKIEKIDIKWFYILLIFGFLVLVFEAIIIKKYISVLTTYDFFISHLVVIPSLLIISLKSKLNNLINIDTRIFRKLSTYIFFFHPFVLELLNILRAKEFFNILNNNIIFFTCVTLITILISLIYNQYEKKGKGIILFLIKLFIISAIIFIIVYPMNNIIWVDEACSLAMNKFSIMEIIKLNSMDVHPPLYYITLKIFDLICHSLLGITNHVLIGKIFSLLPMFLLLLISRIKVKKIWGENTAALFSLLIVIMPQFVQFYYEIRMYSWAMFYVTLTFIYAYQTYKEGKTLDFILLSIFTLLAGYTHLYSALMVGIIYASLFIFYIIKKRSMIKKYMLFAVSTIVGYVPWIVCIFSQIHKVSGGFWIPKITFVDCINYIKFIFMPDTGDEGSKFVLFVLMILLTIYIFVKLIMDKDKRFLIVGFCLPFIVIFIGVTVSIIKNPVFVARYMYPALGCMWLVVSVVLNNTKMNKYIKSISILLLVLVGMSNVNTFIRNEVTLQKDEVRFAELKELLSGGDTIVSDYGHVQLLLAYELYPKMVYQFEQDSDIMINKLFQNVIGNFNLENIIDSLKNKKVVYFIHADDNSNIEERFNNNNIKYEDLGIYREDWYNMKLYKLSY